MSKVILGGSMLVAGTGVGGIGLAVGGARSSQSIVPKSKEVLVVSKAPRCDVYSVVRSADRTGTAKLEDPSFKDGVESEHKQKVDEACAKSNKVYIAKQNEKWVYREADQGKTWTVTSQS